VTVAISTTECIVVRSYFMLPKQTNYPLFYVEGTNYKGAYDTVTVSRI